MFEWIIRHQVLVILLAVGVVFTSIWVMRFRKELSMPSALVPLAAIFTTVSGVAAVRVFAVLESLDSGSGGMSLFGSVFFMPVIFLLIAKLSHCRFGTVADVFTIPMIFSVAMARTNCIFSGCCQGRLLPGAENLRWPTRETELFFYAVLLVILAKKVIRGEGRGRIYPLYMTAYGLFRFVLEWFRAADSPLGIIHMGHIWGLVAMGIGWSIYSELGKQTAKKRGYRNV